MGSKLIHYYSKSHFINITRESTRPLLLGVTHCPALKISKLIHYYSKSHFINITRESTRPLQLGVTHCPALKISQFTNFYYYPTIKYHNCSSLDHNNSESHTAPP